MGVFSERLREVRREKGLCQSELAEKLNVKQATVGSWEKGKTEPSFDLVYRIMEVLGVDANYLFGLS